MIATIPRDALVRLLAQSSALLPARPTNAIFGAIVLHDAEGDLVAESVGDGASGRVSEPAEIKASGRFAVAGREALDRIKLLPGGPVKITLKDGRLTVTSGARKFTLPTLPDAEIPPLAPDAECALVSLPSSSLARAVLRAEYASATDATKGGQCCVHLVIANGLLRVETTDGHRIAQAVERGEWAGDLDVLLAAPEVKILRSILENHDTVEIGSTGIRVLLRAPGVALSLALPSVAFPPVERVLPKTFSYELRVPTKAFRDTMSAAAAHMRGSTRVGVVLGFGDALTVSAENEGHGEFTDSIPCDGTKRPKWELGMNPAYAVSAMASIDTDEVRVCLGGDALAPVVFLPVEGGFGEQTHVVMPARI